MGDLKCLERKIANFKNTHGISTHNIKHPLGLKSGIDFFDLPKGWRISDDLYDGSGMRFEVFVDGTMVAYGYDHGLRQHISQFYTNTPESVSKIERLVYSFFAQKAERKAQELSEYLADRAVREKETSIKIDALVLGEQQ